MINRIAAVASGVALTVLAAGGASASRLAIPGAARPVIGGITAQVAPSVSLAPRIGPPRIRLTVRGSGFAARESVDVYFDITDKALASTSSSGSFTAWLKVPASALPGKHWVTAKGRRSGRSAQAAFTVRANWPQFRNKPNHRGYNATENVLGLSNVAQLGVEWSYPTNGGPLSPAVANGMVYISADGGTVYAFNATTRALKWRYSTVEPTESSPAVANGIVYIGAYTESVNAPSVYALNAYTGTLKWSYATGGSIFSSPAVANGIVYVDGGKMYAFNAYTGALKWSYATGGAGFSSPAVANGTVYTGAGGNVYALNAYTGALKWSYATNGLVESSPAVSKGIVYVGSDDGKVYALNATTGALKWSYATNGQVYSSPAVANGTVYIASHNGLTIGTVYGLNAYTGALKWSFATDGSIRSSPAVANEIVYIGSFNGSVYGLNAVTGALEWSYATGGDIDLSSPAVANGIVYIGSTTPNRSLLAFGLPGGKTDKVHRPNPATLLPDHHLRPSGG